MTRKSVTSYSDCKTKHELRELIITNFIQIAPDWLRGMNRNQVEARIAPVIERDWIELCKKRQ